MKSIESAQRGRRGAMSDGYSDTTSLADTAFIVSSVVTWCVSCYLLVHGVITGLAALVLSGGIPCLAYAVAGVFR